MRGRRAALPGADWQPPEPLQVTPEACTVTFTEESGQRVKTYDFTGLPLAAELQRWLAAAFARVTGPRGGAKRLGSADHYFAVVKKFTSVLAAVPTPPRTPQEVTTAHVAAFRLALTPGSLHQHVHGLRALVRADGDLRPEVRRAICEGRLHRQPLPTVRAYTDAERQQILTAARRDVRLARERIRAGRELLARYRRGELAPGSAQGRTGWALDVLDRTGDVPRHASGAVPDRLDELGGATALLPMLCLTRMEATAFAVLLVDLTGENFGTVAGWPAAHLRPDGGLGEAPVALVEETKPRRGPAREHMVVAVEDLPASLAGAVEGDEERRLSRSPLRTYLLLLDLGSLARRHGGLDRAFSYVALRRARQKWVANMHSCYVGCWGEAHGFPRGPARTGAGPGAGEPPDPPGAAPGKPGVSTQRLRQAALERRRRPVAHAPATLNDYYLRRSPRVVEDSRGIVREALDAEVAKARHAQQVPVFTPGFLERARRDPAGAAAEMGVDTDALARILTRGQDTVLAACTDHRNGPHTPPDTACDASFLACLGCPNARALPHQLPAQVAAHDRLRTLRANLPAPEWEHRYGVPFARLSDLLGHYGAADRQDARARLLPEDDDRITALLDGSLDLR